MHRALLCAFALASICNPTPPAQVVEPLPSVSEAPSNAPSAAPADIGASLDPGTPSAPKEAFQAVSGTLGGKAWALTGAGTTGPLQQDGTVTIALGNYTIDCGLHEQGADDRTITLTVPWRAHAKVDLGALPAKQATATFIDDKKKKPTPIKGWKPKGTLEVVSAPVGAKSSGRIKIALTSGDDAITAEVPVKFCF